MATALWNHYPPDWFTKKDRALRVPLPARHWSFWINWWDGILGGVPLNWELQRDVALIADEVWKKGPVAVAKAISMIERRYATVPSISEAAYADFALDAVHDWMVMVAFQDDLDHLRDPALIRAFSEDCRDLQDQLQDFIDYARDEMRGKANASAAMVIAAEKLVSELARVGSADRLLARRLVQLGRDAVVRAAKQADRTTVGEENARSLDRALDSFRAICRKHLGPVLVRMEPLRDVAVAGEDPNRLFEDILRVVERVKAAKADGLKPLDPEGRAAFDELVDGLNDLRSQIAEATTDERKSYLTQRFAEQYAGTVATLRRYYEKVALHADKAVVVLDRAVKNYGRFDKLRDFWEYVVNLWPF